MAHKYRGWWDEKFFRISHHKSSARRKSPIILSLRDTFLLLATILFLRLSKCPFNIVKKKKRETVLSVSTETRAEQTRSNSSRTSIPTRISSEPYLDPRRATHFTRFFVNCEHGTRAICTLEKAWGNHCESLKYPSY